jgi:hypothetical protein
VKEKFAGKPSALVIATPEHIMTSQMLSIKLCATLAARIFGLKARREALKSSLLLCA